MWGFSTDWPALGLDVSIKAMLLWAVVWLGMRCLRVRNSNLTHRVWTGVLLGMLLMPVLSQLMPALPVPLVLHNEWRPSLMKSTVDNTIPLALAADPAKAASANSSPAGESVERLDGLTDSDADFARRPIGDSESAFAGIDEDKQLPLATAPVTSGNTQLVAETDRHNVTPAAAAISATSGAGSMIARVLVLVWTLGATILGLRVVIGVWLAQRLQRQSRRLDLAMPSRMSVAKCAGIPRAITVRECAQIRVPVSVGVFRPCVLLPAEWADWTEAKLQVVLCHESAHIERGDVLVSFLAEWNRCLYWFHPMAWWLRTRLSDLAEEACDDAAIGETGDATAYARHLLEVAASVSTNRGRLMHAGVSMARESNVEYRINTILDQARPLSRRLSWRTTALVCCIVAPVIGAAAALVPARPAAPDVNSTAGATRNDSQPAEANEDSAAQHNQPNDPQQPQKQPPETVPAADTAENFEPKNDANELRIHGRVTDEAGQPVVDATLQLYYLQGRYWYAATEKSKLIKEWNVDGQGRFDQLVSRALLPPAPGTSEWSRNNKALLVISAPGRVWESRLIMDYNVTKPLEFRLAADVPIHGRIVSLEGRPVAGVRIGYYELVRGEADKINAWLAKTSLKPLAIDQMRLRMQMMSPSGKSSDPRFPLSRNLHLPADLIPPVMTDASGRFELRGVGVDDLAQLTVTGTGIAKTALHVLGREMERVYGMPAGRLGGSGAYYGRKFDYVAQPSVPIEGVVRDIETKEPLTGMLVAVGGVYGTTYSHTGFIVTKTDSQGRYRIEGLPIAPPGTRRWDGNQLSVRPNGKNYIENDNIPVPAGDGLQPVSFDIELRRAVMARGRLVDKTNNQPVQAQLYYAPFKSNENCEHYLRYADDLTTMLGNDSRYHTDADGYFEIPVIPGRGVICAKCDVGLYRTGYSATEIPEFSPTGDQRPQIVTSDHVIPSMYHSLLEVNPSQDVDHIDVTMQVDPGLSLRVRFVDPEGRPLKGVTAGGILPDRSWKVFDEAEVEAVGLAVGEIRPVIAMHDGRRLARLMRIIPQAGQTELTIELLPYTVVTGRLLVLDDKPLAEVAIAARHQNDPDFLNSQPSVQTDSQGRFEYRLPVGATYRLIGVTNKHFTVAKDLELNTPQQIMLGDLVVDPDAERWAEVKAKRAPIVNQALPTE